MTDTGRPPRTDAPAPRAASTRSPTPAPSPSGPPSPIVAVLAMVAVAVNLRTLMASIPPLVDTLQSDLGLSNVSIGVLTTLPVLCMGVFAPVAQRLARRAGAAPAVLLAVLLVLAGTLLRGLGSDVWPLYLGTLVAGAGIAVAGTLLPGLVKQLVPARRTGLATGTYMVAMMAGATASSALSVPFAAWLGGWTRSLASWSAIALVGVAAWAPLARRLRGAGARTPDAAAADHRLPWRHPTAWLLAGYLAASSWQFYSSLAWLAPTFVEQGWTPTRGAYALSVFSAVQIGSGLLGPALADRVPDRRRILVPTALCAFTAELGLWLAPGTAPWLWAALLGIGQGAAFALGLVLLVTSAATPTGSARLSGMVLLISYGVASVGPTTMGAVRDATGSFAAVWALLALVMLPQLGFSVALSPRRRLVE